MSTINAGPTIEEFTKILRTTEERTRIMALMLRLASLHGDAYFTDSRVARMRIVLRELAGDAGIDGGRFDAIWADVFEPASTG